MRCAVVLLVEGLLYHDGQRASSGTVMTVMGCCGGLRVGGICQISDAQPVVICSTPAFAAVNVCGQEGDHAPAPTGMPSRCGGSTCLTHDVHVLVQPVLSCSVALLFSANHKCCRVHVSASGHVRV